MTAIEHDDRPVSEWPQTIVRLGDDLRERLIREAKAAERTLTAEIRLRLRQSLNDSTNRKIKGSYPAGQKIGPSSSQLARAKRD